MNAMTKYFKSSKLFTHLDSFLCTSVYCNPNWIFDHDEQGLLLQKVIFCTTVQFQLQFCGIINLMHQDWKQTQSNMGIHE